MPDLVKAVDASGDTDADWQNAKPYLEAFTVIASGRRARRQRAAVPRGRRPEVSATELHWPRPLWRRFGLPSDSVV
jgi:hypothetical protein